MADVSLPVCFLSPMPMSPLPSRLAALVLLLGLAGCDSAGDGPQPYTGVIEVSLVAAIEGRTDLRVVAVDDAGCQHPLVVKAEARPASLHVRVRGIGPGPVRGVECQAVAPAQALVSIPFESLGEFSVEVAHAGSEDAYAYATGIAGPVLRAVRTSTTRLAAP